MTLMTARIRQKQRTGFVVTLWGLFFLLCVAPEGVKTAQAEGIDVRGAGCIGPCRNAACCKKGILLNPNGVGYARDFICVDFMRNKATAAERAWICSQLRKNDDVCPELSVFCPCTEEQRNRGMVTTESGCMERNDYCEKLRDPSRRYDFDRLRDSFMRNSKTFRDHYQNYLKKVPNAVIDTVIDFDLRDEAGGGTTTGSCNDRRRTIIINPVTICKKSTRGSPRDIVTVFLHEFGHVVTCLGPTPPEGPERDRRAQEEEAAASEFARQVESEIYTEPGPKRDPFRNPFQ